MATVNYNVPCYHGNSGWIAAGNLDSREESVFGECGQFGWSSPFPRPLRRLGVRLGQFKSSGCKGFNLLKWFHDSQRCPAAASRVFLSAVQKKSYFVCKCVQAGTIMEICAGECRWVASEAEKVQSCALRVANTSVLWLTRFPFETYVLQIPYF